LAKIAIKDVEEKQMDAAAQHPPSGLAPEKSLFNHKEALQEETAHEAAERGHVATDK
jgi:hypothetical protein